MTKFQVSLLGVSESHRVIKKYLRAREQGPRSRDIYGDHNLHRSDLKWYVQAGYIDLKIEGPWQSGINRFLKNRMWIGCFYLPSLHGLVLEDIVDDATLSHHHHLIDLKSGVITPLDIGGVTIKGVRGEGPELLVLVDGSWEWRLYNVLSGVSRTVSSFGAEAYLSGDGAYMFPLENWSSIGLVDLNSGILLDRKNKRHFSKYATKVKIIEVLDFDPLEPAFTILLMKQLELSFSSLRHEVCLRLGLDL